jgi:phosphoribosyl 1,2-cyclic phosphodiesterase
VRITLWGTRGSLPSLGPENAVYGGNTPCVEVRGEDGTVLVLDAGTGIRRLGTTIGADVHRVDVLLTHLHMDHLQGLGFFAPLFRPDMEVNVWGPGSTSATLRDRVLRGLSPPLYPVRLRDLPSRISMLDVPRGAFEIGSITVTADFICHPGATVGYRVEEAGLVLTYLPDHEPALGVPNFPDQAQWTSGYGLAKDAALLIHDSTYSAVEYPQYRGWGHSAIDHAIALGVLAKVRRLVTFHHDPGHDDVMLDRMLDAAVAAAPPPFAVSPGTEGASFRVGG